MGRRKRKAFLGCGGALLVAIAFVLFSGRHFLFGRKHYDVVPISAAAEYQSPDALKRAFALPVAARYAAGPIVFQSNGSTCGPTSVANVARTLDKPGATAGAVLEGTGKCSLGICFGGLTLDELAEVATKATGRKITVLRDLTRAQLVEHLAKANDPARRYILNFDRGPLFGTSGGHHSPIAGYLADEDLVLVVDVNEEYKPWLVRADRLYEAMDTIDPSTGKKRGLLLLE